MSLTVSVLVVAGGGGGGGEGGGGGGGGGDVLADASHVVVSTAYAVTVGAGGAAGVAGNPGTTGGDSVFDSITAKGGGGGGSYNNRQAGKDGGSGGGGCGEASGIGGAAIGSGHAGAHGGLGAGGSSNGGGGGGGASAAGSVGVADGAGGAGGNGSASSISGSSVTYGGGGGGSDQGSGAGGGTGGTGGGGAGSTGGGANSVAGTANRGGGGGGGAAGNGQLSAAGGSGVVIISYATGSLVATGGAITTSGGNTIHTFTSSGTFTVAADLSVSLTENLKPRDTDLTVSTGVYKNPTTGISFVVPTGVTLLRVKAWGAGGGASNNGSRTGGGGGFAQADIAVTPAETLTIKVGGGGAAGTNPGGASGAGGGGGYSGVFRSTTPLVVGGGGGGGAAHGPGGWGGQTGGDGSNSSGGDVLSTGKGGTSAAGGAAATGSTGSAATAGASLAGGNGGGGTLANGGAGGTNGGGNGGGQNATTYGGGGGGGGLYGGGGGAGTNTNSSSGGGGSSFADGSSPVFVNGSTNSSTDGANRTDEAYISGVADGGSGSAAGGGGLVVISYEVGSVAFTLSATANAITTGLPSVVLTQGQILAASPQLVVMALVSPRLTQGSVLNASAEQITVTLPTALLTVAKQLSASPLVVRSRLGGAQIAFTDIVLASPLALTVTLPSATITGGLPLFGIFTLFIGGVDFSSRFDRHTWHINRQMNESPSTMSVDVWGVPPPSNQAAVLSFGTEVIGWGTVIRVSVNHTRLNEGRTIYKVTVLDWVWALDGEGIVTAQLTDLDPTQAATQLLAFAPNVGFSIGSIEAGLPHVTLNFKSQPLSACLRKLADAVNGQFFFDYQKKFYLFAADSPKPLLDPIVAGGLTTKAMVSDRDIQAVRNQIWVEGQGVSLLADVWPGDTFLPVETSSVLVVPGAPIDQTNYKSDPFDPTGGLVQIGLLTVHYVGFTYRIDKATEVAGQPGPIVGAPLPSLAVGAGHVVGSVRYAVAYQGNGQSSDAGASSLALLCPEFTAPAFGITGVVQRPTSFGPNAPGPLIGTYKYSYSFVTELGETLPGAAQATGVAAKYVPQFPTNALLQAVASKLSVGTYRYALSVVTPYGESDLGAQITVTVPGFGLPPAPSQGSFVGGGSLVVGHVYNYAVTYVTTNGETTQGVASSFVMSGGNLTTRMFIAGGANILARRVYRQEVIGGAAGQYRLIFEIAGGVDTFFTDDGTQTGGQAAPLVSSAGAYYFVQFTVPQHQGEINSIRVYRSAVNQTTLKYVGETTALGGTFTDNVPDTGLGAAAPNPGTVGFRFDLGGIGQGATGTMARRLYRTKAGGSQLFLLAQFNDNTTNVFADNIPDAQLGAQPPLQSTAGASKVFLQSIPTGPGWVVGRIIYRTEANGAVFRTLTTISNNTQTTYVDAAADSELGAIAQPGSGIGPQKGDTQILVKDGSLLPNDGWLRVGGQLIKYGGRNGTVITGIPSNGADPPSPAAPVLTPTGGITGSIPVGSPVDVIAGLRNVTGLSAVEKAGTPVAPVAMAEDAASELEFGTRSFWITDGRYDSATCAIRAQAELAMRKDEIWSGTIETRDQKAVPGAQVLVNVSEWDIDILFVVSEVELSMTPNDPYPIRRGSITTRVITRDILGLFALIAQRGF